MIGSGRLGAVAAAFSLVAGVAAGAQPAAAAPVAGSIVEGHPPADVVAPDVVDALDDGPAVVVVALRTPEPAQAEIDGDREIDSRAADVAAIQTGVLEQVPPGTLRAVHRFENVPALVAVVDDPSAVAALAANPDAARVSLDVGGTALLTEVVPLVGADVRHTAGVDGTGVTVAVIDSGVEGDHLDLVSSVALDQACFGYDGGDPATGFCPDGTEEQIGLSTDVPPPAVDGEGHGTHVSGIITSDGVVAPVGVAPGATIMAIKSLNDAGGFTSFTLNIVAALDHLIANPQLGVDIVNMSLGTSAEFAGDCDTATAYTIAGAAAVDTLRAQGVTVFAASGGSSSGTTMPAPACLSNVISVGATDDSDVVATFSNSNSVTDVFAPGVTVVSADIPATTSTRSGTSQASAVAAACAALLIDAGQASDPDSVEARLETSAVLVTDPTNGLTFPRVDCATDLPPLISPGVAAVVEGDGGSSVVDVPVTLSNSSTTPVTVDWATLDTGGSGIATEGVDYVAAAGTVTFLPGETLQTVPITVLGDVIDEPPLLYGEWGLIQFSDPSPNATLDLSFFGLGLFIVVDDDDPPVISPGAASVLEGDTGPTVVDVPVTLSNPSATTVTVDWATLDPGGPGIATEGVDYVAATGTVTFLPGETLQTVPITVLGDLIDEPPLLYGEWGLIQFSDPSSNATLDTTFFGLGIFVIVDDDE